MWGTIMSDEKKPKRKTLKAASAVGRFMADYYYALDAALQALHGARVADAARRRAGRARGVLRQ